MSVPLLSNNPASLKQPIYCIDRRKQPKHFRISVLQPMPFCQDGRWHATQGVADACRHHKDNKDFRTVNKFLPSCAAPKKRRARTTETIEEDVEEQEDDDADLPIAPPVTPTPKPRPTSESHSSSTQEPGYPTPPLTQDVEDMDDNIVVAMPPSSQMTSSSPMPAVPRRSEQSSPSCGAQLSSSNRGTPEADNDNDLDDIPGPLSSSPPPAAPHSPTPAQSAATTSRIPETVLDGTNNRNVDNDDGRSTSNVAELNNTILALRADRARLTDALSTSTFRTQNLLTRARLQRIENQLARAEISQTQAQASTAWEAVDAAREARKNAWVSVAIVLVLVMGYAVWCWWYSVEMRYVRGRTCGVYGLGVDC